MASRHHSTLRWFGLADDDPPTKATAVILAIIALFLLGMLALALTGNWIVVLIIGGLSWLSLGVQKLVRCGTRRQRR